MAALNTIREQQDEVVQLGVDEADEYSDVLDDAQDQLATAMPDWVETDADGEERWAAHKYRDALLVILAIQALLRDEMEKRLRAAGDKGQVLGIDHTQDLLVTFGGTKVTLSRAEIVASGQSYLITRYRTSAARYGNQFARDILQRLVTDIRSGASITETIDRLVQSAGPRGLVALRGVVGEKGAVVENIPEGLFVRYRDWAERLVRTETSSAYTATARESRRAAGNILPGMMKKFIADATACSDKCAPVSGQVVAEFESFTTPVGLFLDPPLHPRCGCVAIPWMPSWNEELGDLLD